MQCFPEIASQRGYILPSEEYWFPDTPPINIAKFSSDTSSSGNALQPYLGAHSYPTTLIANLPSFIPMDASRFSGSWIPVLYWAPAQRQTTHFGSSNLVASGQNMNTRFNIGGLLSYTAPVAARNERGREVSEGGNDTRAEESGKEIGGGGESIRRGGKRTVMVTIS